MRSSQFRLKFDDVKRIAGFSRQLNVPDSESDTAVTFENNLYETDDFLCCIEVIWSDSSYIGVSGWVAGKAGRTKAVKSLTLNVDGHQAEITDFVSRPDVVAYFAGNKNVTPKAKCGFNVIIERNATHMLAVDINGTGIQRAPVPVTSSIQLPSEAEDFSVHKKLERTFRNLVNKNELKVLEVGSRISPGGVNKRKFFKNAKEYVGVDYLDGETVDKVCDAHEISKVFKPGTFDAVYSDSVLEHLAMPWKAAIEINKVMKVGGYTFHSAPSTWVPHDRPWDFWRFQDAGLKALFSESFGFKVIDVEHTCPMSLHPHKNLGHSYARFPTSPAFGFVSILAKKIKDIDEDRVRFDHPISKVVDPGTSYPVWANGSMG